MFIRQGWLILLFALSFQSFADNSERYYLVPQDIAPSLSAATPLVAQHGKYRLVKMTLDQAAALSEQVHHKKKTCGGFIDVDEEVKAGHELKNLVHGLEAQRVSKQSFPEQAQYLGEVRAALQEVQKPRFLETLTRLTDFPDRSARSENGVAAARWIKDKMTSWASSQGRTDVEYMEVESSWAYRQPSIVVRLKGADATLPAIVLGGHMDTFDRHKPGADDDATGTATVMEVFRSLVNQNMKFKRDIYFAFYAAEERGLVGSGKVSQKFSSEGRTIRGVMQFDMTGFAPKIPDKEMFFVMDYTDPALTQYTKMLAQTYLQLKPEQIGELRCGYPCSDHASWYRRGYATVYPFESTFDDYNGAIHTSQDTINRLDIEHALKYLRLGVAFAVELAEPVRAE